jgi:1-deoxy-D-xylulose-5-phosphate synthase
MLAVDRAGLVGADGPTHAGSFDLSFLRCIPNMLIAAPSDENECRRLLTTAFRHDGPSAVRYPRGSGTGAAIDCGLEAVEIGKGVLRRSGRDVALIAFGSLVTSALAAAEALDASVADMRFVKPLDVDLLRELAQGHRLLVTLEENTVAGGAGAGVAEALAELGLDVPVLHLGLPDRFIEHGDPAKMLADCGLDATGIEAAVRRRITLLPE